MKEQTMNNTLQTRLWAENSGISGDVHQMYLDCILAERIQGKSASGPCARFNDSAVSAKIFPFSVPCTVFLLGGSGPSSIWDVVVDFWDVLMNCLKTSEPRKQQVYRSP
jgi:hypothetical protein